MKSSCLAFMGAIGGLVTVKASLLRALLEIQGGHPLLLRCFHGLLLALKRQPAALIIKRHRRQGNGPVGADGDGVALIAPPRRRDRLPGPEHGAAGQGRQQPTYHQKNQCLPRCRLLFP